MRIFLEKYILPGVYLFIAVPRLVLGAMLIFLPGLPVAYLLASLLPSDAQLLASLAALCTSFYVSAETPYARLVEWVLPFGPEID